MNINGKELDDKVVEMIMKELMDRDGDMPSLISNILRNWSKEKIDKFAFALIGETYISKIDLINHVKGRKLTEKEKEEIREWIDKANSSSTPIIGTAGYLPGYPYPD